MKRVFAFLCVLAMILSLVPATALAAEQDLQAVINAGTEEIIVLEADASNVTVNRDMIIDLNGHNIDGVTVTGGTLYLLDSQTADYTVADGVYGKVTGVTGSVQAAEGYLQVGESFHAVNLDIYAMTLRASDVGVYYKTRFEADEVVAAQVESFGVALSVVTAPNAENLDSYCGYSVFTGFEAGKGANAAATSTLLKNIMKASNGDNKNAKNAAMPVYGRAYIKTAEGYFFGETVERSLQQQVELIDAKWAGLKDTQKAPVLEMLENYGSVMGAWSIPNILGGEAGDGMGEIEIDVPVTTESGIVTEAATVEQGAVSITVPAGVKLAEGATSLTLTVTPVEAEDTGLTLKENRVLIPMDVHVEGVAADNAQPITIYLGKIMPENLNMGNYTVYHVENGNANEMTLIGVNEEFTTHNQYKYTLDGELTLYMASFSVVAAEVDEEAKWEGGRDYSWYKADADTLYIRNADQLAGFGAIVGGMDGREADDFEGKTVVLLADISIGDLTDEDGRKAPDGSNLVFYPIGYYNNEGTYTKSGTAITSAFKSFAGTFDGNGNTISDFYQNTWEMKGDHNWYAPEDQYYRDGMGLFGKVYGGTVKNLTVRNFSCDSEIGTTGTIAAYAEGATFENIAIFDCNPRVYNIGNGGIVGCVGWYAKEAGLKTTFTNITVDNSNKISALWGSYDVACGGIVGQYYPTSGQDDIGNPKNAGIHLENCHVAAQMDVYNDVCGNYMYYAYRYAGMLIGSVRENETVNGRVYPKLDGITANACTVHYGEWNHYYYCEFESNGHPSYAQADEYKFSRISESELVRDEAGKVIGCTHDHTEAEDNRAVYLPFYDQLVTGYGWGVTSKGIADIPGVKVLDREVADSVEKFEALVENGTTYATGSSFEIGSLFAAIEQNDAAIVGENVQVTVSPANDESDVSGTYVANADDWTKGTLTLSGTGSAIISITDYYFCTPATIQMNVQSTVAMIGEVEYTSLQAALDAVEDGDEVKLVASVTASEYLDVHTDNMGETERSITLNLNGNTVTPAANYNYKWYPLVFVGINQTLTINDGSIVTDEHTAIGVYGSLVLNNVHVERNCAEGETIVCIWNWGEDDKYYEDCRYQLTGSATINGGSIEGGVLVEGPVTLKAGTEIDKLYLNTATGYGKFILPSGYGLKKEGDYYANLHEHDEDGENNACSVCGLAFFYEKTDLAYIDSTDTVVITMTKEGTTWALTNGNGTTAAPAATVIKVDGNKISGEVADALKWNISSSNDGMTIYPDGSTATWLYCTETNNGVRVGVNAEYQKFVIANNGYLYNTATERYVGVYNEQDWRGYEPIPENDSNSNIKGQTLAFYVLKSNCAHNGSKDNREAVAATCTVAGREAGVYCLDCDTYIDGGELINATGHDFGDPTSTKEATCSADGKNTYHCTVCHKVKTEKIPATEDHNFGEDGKCTNEGCTAEQVITEPNSTTYTFSDYTAGTQYGEGEEHVLDDKVTIVTTQCHFTTQLRIYSSTTHNGYAVIKSECGIAGIAVNAGNEKDMLIVYGSDDEGTTWTEAAKISVESTSYNDYFAELAGTYKWLKLDVVGENQVRLQSMTLTFADQTGGDNGEEPETPACQHANRTTTNTATCGQAGVETVTCDDCGETISETSVEATGEHNYVEGACSNCGVAKPTETVTVEATISFANSTQRVSQTAGSQVWQNDGVTFTNNRNGAQAAVVGNTNPVRLYSGSEIVIACAGKITKIVFHCNTTSYATELKNSIGDTASVSGKVVTVTLDGTGDTLTIAKLTAKVFVDSITVTYKQ